MAGDQAGADELQAHPEADLYTVAKRYLTKQGGTLWINLCVRAVRDEQQRFVCYMVVAVSVPRPDSFIIPQAPRTFSLARWLKENPRDALLYGTAAVAIFGRDTVIDLVKLLLAK